MNASPTSWADSETIQLPQRKSLLNDESPVDVIIPCRNEEGTIGGVIDAFVAYKRVRVIFVAIDPETTDTSEMVTRQRMFHYRKHAEAAHIIIVRAPYPGKGQVIKSALEFVETERVAFCDSDLVGLSVGHVAKLLAGNGLTIGVPDYPDRVPYPFKVESFYAAWPWVSGMRSMPTWVARPLALHGYLVEVQINSACQHFHLSPNLVSLHGVTAPMRLNQRRMEEMERDRRWGLENGVLKH